MAWPWRCGNSDASNARSSSWTGSKSVKLRRRVNAGLNKGEARNALARAVFFYRLGELRDRSFEKQRYRASGLNLVTAAIVLWNTVYLERAARALQRHAAPPEEDLLRYLSPLGWEHINFTGGYVWRQNRPRLPGKFRPLRVPPELNARFFPFSDATPRRALERQNAFQINRGLRHYPRLHGEQRTL